MSDNLDEIRKKIRKSGFVNTITAEEMPDLVKVKRALIGVRNMDGNHKERSWRKVWKIELERLTRELEPLSMELRSTSELAGTASAILDHLEFILTEQVWSQIWISRFLRLKEVGGYECEHPAFDLARMGVIVVHHEPNFKVFGAEGKFLGEFPASELKVANNHIQAKPK